MNRVATGAVIGIIIGLSIGLSYCSDQVRSDSSDKNHTAAKIIGVMNVVAIAVLVCIHRKE